MRDSCPEVSMPISMIFAHDAYRTGIANWATGQLV